MIANSWNVVDILDSAFVIAWLPNWPEHDIFRFEFLRKKVSKFYFSERNSRRLFGFPRGEGVEILFFDVKKPSTIYFSERSNRRLFVFPRGEGVEFLSFREWSKFRLSDRGRRIFIFRKESSSFNFSTRRSRRLSIFRLFTFRVQGPSTIYLLDRRSRRFSIFPTIFTFQRFLSSSWNLQFWHPSTCFPASIRRPITEQYLLFAVAVQLSMARYTQLYAVHDQGSKDGERLFLTAVTEDAANTQR